MMSLDAIRRKQWADRQDTLRAWRNGIWDSRDEAAIQKYVDWHLDFFTRFYVPPASVSERILDIGCGYLVLNFDATGQLDRVLGLLKAGYIGIDPVGEWLKPPRGRAVALCRGLGEALPFADGHFGGTLLLGVLDHVLNPDLVLREAYRVTKPGGTLWFANSYIEGDAWSVWKEKLLHRLGFDDHHRFVWTPPDMEELIRRAGFTVERTDRCACDVSYYVQAGKPGRAGVP